MDLQSLGPTAAAVIITVAFLKYLSSRDKEFTDTLKELNINLNKLNKITDINTEQTIVTGKSMKRVVEAVDKIPVKLQDIADVQAEAVVKNVNGK